MKEKYIQQKSAQNNGAFHYGKFLFASLLIIFVFSSCEEDGFGKGNVYEDGISSRSFNLSSVDLSNIDLSLSFDVVTDRQTTFRNEINEDSPGWKKLAVRSETESYSYSFGIDNGDVSCVIDNYTFDCIDQKRKKENSQMVRFEYDDGGYKTYDKNGQIIDQRANTSIPFDQLDLLIFKGLDTATLSEMAIHYELIEDKIAGVVDRANGLGFAGTFVYDLNLGRMIYVALQNESDQITSIMSNAFDQQGKLLSSIKLFYDYLEDGDVMITHERSAYNNFTLNSYKSEQ